MTVFQFTSQVMFRLQFYSEMPVSRDEPLTLQPDFTPRDFLFRYLKKRAWTSIFLWHIQADALQWPEEQHLHGQNIVTVSKVEEMHRIRGRLYLKNSETLLCVAVLYHIHIDNFLSAHCTYFSHLRKVIGVWCICIEQRWTPGYLFYTRPYHLWMHLLPVTLCTLLPFFLFPPVPPLRWIRLSASPHTSAAHVVYLYLGLSGCRRAPRVAVARGSPAFHWHPMLAMAPPIVSPTQRFTHLVHFIGIDYQSCDLETNVSGLESTWDHFLRSWSWSWSWSRGKGLGSRPWPGCTYLVTIPWLSHVCFICQCSIHLCKVCCSVDAC